ncbi:hypothetical protein O7632_23755 [Solwaraspora sp. WMMD406]|uniref:hypothetical protein n=1 Tax=Solwaraspora sp. WMMD406 TaxID=3016095 RepID=UPI0024178972|nr:hypothetical protein [Solwaraspora sp. WMMD406]MDG4767088.1 hypothetical protein [Solwaraspora sp. WMMD406]
MPVVERGVHHDTEVLLRQVDGLVALLRARYRRLDPQAVARFADSLRALIISSGPASAVERARVRATVHSSMLLAGRHGLLPEMPVLSTASASVGGPPTEVPVAAPTDDQAR